MKVLVTGGAGFIGSHITEQLLLQQYEVVIVDDLSSGNINNLDLNSVEYYNVSILSESLEDVFANERPQVVIHLAAQTNVQYSIDYPGIDGSVNVIGTINVLECCRRYGVKKIIFASSAAVYGEPKYLGVDEKHSLNPMSFYGLSKKVGEEYIKMYRQLYNIKYTILRYANVFGPRQTNKGEAGVVTIFIDRILRGEPLIIFGDGKQTRDFIYVEDLARASILAITNGDNEVLNISTNFASSLLDLVNILEQLANKKLTLRMETARPGDIQDSILTNQKAIDYLNWEPYFTLKDGLQKTLAYYGNLPTSI